MLDSEAMCPCTSDKRYQDCCRPFIEGGSYPEKAEQLMRSRFCAFVLKNESYLLKTWCTANRPDNIDFDSSINWQKLVINGRKKGRRKDKEGWVTFIAHYQAGEQSGYLHEKSYFVRDSEQHWCYQDGEIKD
ncbi:YchJ family protein [Thiomicrorhabdus sediminis]|uniref:YchJ-like middle NTF2-like domain-containing protein n=1 Tax=Thiomicrorhabdus sediminis TaxID=2580412 RepID=A0A4V1HHT3_9GAMM|nr:YchJ family metal-binding protein [Thiomicrorhabdus sediminis]QCU90123.1 hypothetical protein FE785_05495 [Thiomicrorhabdus sediminis]